MEDDYRNTPSKVPRELLYFELNSSDSRLQKPQRRQMCKLCRELSVHAAGIQLHQTVVLLPLPPPPFPPLFFFQVVSVFSFSQVLSFKFPVCHSQLLLALLTIWVYTVGKFLQSFLRSLSPLFTIPFE